jgi:AraC-like DNA-binding protein
MKFRDVGTLRVRVYRRAWFPCLTDDLHITRIALERWKFGSKVYSSSEKTTFILPLRGELFEERESRTVGGGRVLLIPRQARPVLRVPGKTDLRLIIAWARGAVVEECLQSCGPQDRTTVLPAGEEQRSTLGKALQHGRHVGRTQQKTGELYFRTFLSLLMMQRRTAAKGDGQARHRFAEVRQQMISRFLDWPSLATAAENLGLSVDYLNRLFRRFEGQTAGVFLRSLKMQQAARWYREDQMKLEQIAARLGYSDAFSLSKAFSRHFGTPPSRW